MIRREKAFSCYKYKLRSILNTKHKSYWIAFLVLVSAAAFASHSLNFMHKNLSFFLRKQKRGSDRERERE